mmetsp:Transcript_22394/g.40351  ORF Transcript_22394/g.40351 Transcript_22394/m.40351 type:complete len:369 (+) Transcript_22394:82-1188(+)
MQCPDALPTLLGSRRQARGLTETAKGLQISIPEPKEPSQTLPEDYTVRVRNTFIDIQEEEQQQPAGLVQSCPARHAGRIEQHWQEAGNDAGLPTAVQRREEPQRQVITLETALAQAFPGTPESFPIPSMRPRLSMATEAVSYETSRPAEHAMHHSGAQAPAAALGLVSAPNGLPAETAHAVYKDGQPQVQAFDAVQAWPGSETPMTNHHGYVAHNGYAMEQVHQAYPGFQAPVTAPEVHSQMRADAAPWYSSQSQMHNDAAMMQSHMHNDAPIMQSQVLAAQMAAPAPSAAPALMAQPSPAPVQPAPGSAELPSLGSEGHDRGDCKPCAFLHTKGCENGAMCKFCHKCDAGEKKRRQKDKRQMIRGGA